MAKQLRKWLVSLTLTGAVLSITLSCSLFDDRIELERNYELRDYSINPETILESLDQGDENVFTLQTVTPEVTSSTPAAPVSWSQADYLRIAQALHEQAWGEPLGAKNLFNVSFDMDCADIERGTFSDATFDSYTIIQTVEEETRIEYWILITPLKNSVSTSKQEFRPNVHSLKPIDLEQYRITAEEALQIAEKNGGSEKRLEVDNACEIDALAPGPDIKDWRIIYVNVPNLIKRLFEIAIDPQTGEYRVLYPKP